MNRTRISRYLLFLVVAAGLIAVIALTRPISSTAQTGSATTAYEYDDAGRLTRVNYSNGMEIVYTYDPAGNLLERRVAKSDTGVDSWPAW